MEPYPLPSHISGLHGPGSSKLERGREPDIIAHPRSLSSPRSRSRLLEFLAPVLNIEFAFAVAITCVGAFTYGFAGFGGGLSMTPLLAILYGPAEAIIIANLIPPAVGAVGWPNTLPHVRWSEVVPIIIGMAVCAPAGVYLLLATDPDLIRRAMGLIVLGFAGLMFAGWTYKGPRTIVTGCTTGGVSGMAQGAVGMGGTIISLYFLSVDEESKVQRANLYISTMSQSAVVSVPLIIAGVLDAPTLIRCVVLAPIYAVVLWAGGAAFRRTSDLGYRRIAIWILVGIGVIAVAS